MSRINLLPPEIRAQRLDAHRAGRIRRWGGIALVLLALAYAGRTTQIVLADRELTRLEAESAAVAADVAALDDIRVARDELVASREREAALMLGEVSWSEQLLEVARVVPAGFVFTSLSGQSTPGQTQGVIGSISFQAVARRLGPTQMLLLRLRTHEGWADGWISSISGDGTNFDVSGSVNLTADVLTDRGAGA